MTLTCIPAGVCFVDCKSCEGTTINANNATQLSVNCVSHSDCNSVIINCQTSTGECYLNCKDEYDLNVTNICTNALVNCGTGECTVNCLGTNVRCVGITVDITLSTNYSCFGDDCSSFSIIPTPTNKPSLHSTQFPTSTAVPSNNPSTQLIINSTTNESTLVPTPTFANDTWNATPAVNASTTYIDRHFLGFLYLDLESIIFLSILLLLLFLFIITCLAVIHKEMSFPCCLAADDANVMSLIAFALLVCDFFSDSNFAFTLNQNQCILLFRYSLVFLCLPWILNIVWLLIQRKKWSEHPLINVWVRNHGYFLISITMLTGSVNGAIKLCNSRLFGLKIFSMCLPKYEYIRLSKWPILLSLVFENIPQIVVQWLFISNYGFQKGSTFKAVYFSFFSSVISAIFALIMLALRSCENFDDCQFAIHIEIVRKHQNMKRLKNSLGKRIAIASAIADVLDMNADMTVVDRITLRGQKLTVYISIAGYVSKAEGKIEEEERKEDYIDELFGKMIGANNNGEFAIMFKTILKLQSMPVIYKISDIKVGNDEDIQLELVGKSISQKQINIKHISQRNLHLTSTPIFHGSDGNTPNIFNDDLSSSGEDMVVDGFGEDFRPSPSLIHINTDSMTGV